MTDTISLHGRFEDVSSPLHAQEGPEDEKSPQLDGMSSKKVESHVFELNKHFIKRVLKFFSLTPSPKKKVGRGAFLLEIFLG